MTQAISIQLNFLADVARYKTEKPYRILASAEIDPSTPRTNVVQSEKEATVSNIRSTDFQPCLDANGFQYLHHISQHLPCLEHLGSEATTQKLLPYLRETKELLSSFFNGEKVLIVDWKVSCVIYKLPSNNSDTSPSIGSQRKLPRRQLRTSPSTTLLSRRKADTNLSRRSLLYTQVCLLYTKE